MRKAYVLCEFSGEVRDALAAEGWDAWSCDLLPSERPGKHIQADIRELDYSGVLLVIAHTPCTNTCNSGVRWLWEREGRMEAMVKDALLLKWVLDLPVPHIAAENSIPHRYAVGVIGRKYDQLIQPWMFGHGETKATCFWLKGLPKLIPTDIVPGRVDRVHREPPSPNRWRERSRTYHGIALAMAKQWGGSVTE